MTMTSRHVRLERTGLKPLAFEGELVGSVNSRVITETKNGRKMSPRWFELSLYKTIGGAWVGQIRYVTKWRGEQGFVTSFTVRDEPIDSFRLFSVDEHVEGFPEGSGNDDRQERLLDFLRKNYRQAVTDLMMEVPELDQVIDE